MTIESSWPLVIEFVILNNVVGGVFNSTLSIFYDISWFCISISIPIPAVY
jgi:hypothetical protein